MTQLYDPNTAASVTATAQKILMPMIKQLTPQLLAQSILGVQPMTGDIGSIFTMRANYTPQLKYKFSRAHWYEAVFDINKYTDVVQWCTEHFGPHPRNPDAWSRWNHKFEDRIYFRDSKDYEWFMLRWS
jgi:hypothetical protein